MNDDGLTWDDIPSVPYYPDRTRVQLRNYMSQQNRRRWRRFLSDYEWVRKEMRDMGLNPEDTRFLL